MKRTQKNILTSITLLSLTLLSSGCAPKNADGTYHSTYSYHPYNTVKQNEIRNFKNSHITINIPKHPIQKHKHQYNIYTPKSYAKAMVNYKAPKPSIGKNIENVAKSLLGADYQYGANGPYQYDCSGFTKFVFSRQGINLPRISRDQATVGEFIRATQLQKGDLIFFDSKKSSKVSHVGIYLGSGEFIHASSSKDKVIISNLNSNYYSKHFKWGRRVTKMSYARK